MNQIESKDRLKDATKTPDRVSSGEARRAFLKKAGIIAVAAPVMESLSKEGLLVRSAHAQTAQFDGFGGPRSGPIQSPF